MELRPEDINNGAPLLGRKVSRCLHPSGAPTMLLSNRATVRTALPKDPKAIQAIGIGTCSRDLALRLREAPVRIKEPHRLTYIRDLAQLARLPAALLCRLALPLLRRRIIVMLDTEATLRFVFLYTYY